MGADLTTYLGPLKLKNPLIASSSELTMSEAGIRACVEAGAGAVVAKSVNESPAAAAQLNIADYTLVDAEHRAVPWESATITASLFNRSGLAGGDLDNWIEMLGRCHQYAVGHGSIVIGSITVAEADPAARIAARLAEAVPAIEINLGAPHGREARAVRQVTAEDEVAAYVAAVRKAISVPLIVKLPGQGGDIVALARAARLAGADVVSMVGRLNGFLPNVDTWEPELGSWGAIGGPWSMPLSLYWVSKAWRELDVPLIGTGGARTGLDLARFLLSGATAIEAATPLLIEGPGAAARMLAELRDYLAVHDVRSVRELVGESARRAASYGELTPPPDPSPWSQLVNRALSAAPGLSVPASVEKKAGAGDDPSPRTLG